MPRPEEPLICLDARWIFKEISGIGRVAEKLISHLAELEGPERYLALFSDPFLQAEYSRRWAGRKNLETELIPWKIFSSAGQIALPRFLRRRGVSLFHSLNFFLPLGPGRVPMISTVHDLIPLKFPHFTPKARKTRFNFLFRFLLRRCSNRARRIMTVSEHTAADLRQCLGIRPEKIAVVPNGVDEVYRPLEPEGTRAGLPEGFPPGKPFALYVGRFDPYKNVPGLIRAFARARAEGLREARLVVVGHRDERYPEAFREADRLLLGPDVTFLDGASESELVSLYNAARVLVLPSFYEGFGLPPLEAMACGTPVAVSDRGSLPEVVGDAGLYLNPEREENIAAALLKIWNDEGLRTELSRRGLRRAAEFSWGAAAERTRKAYRAVLAGEALP